MKKEVPETVSAERTFSKGAILKSQTYAERRDALSFLLHDGEMYTHAQIEEILKEYYERKV